MTKVEQFTKNARATGAKPIILFCSMSSTVQDKDKRPQDKDI